MGWIRIAFWFPVTFTLAQLLRLSRVGDFLIPVADRLLDMPMEDADSIKAPLFYALIRANLRSGNKARADELTREVRSTQKCANTPWTSGSERDYLPLGVAENVIEIYAEYDVCIPEPILDDLQALSNHYLPAGPELPKENDHYSNLQLVERIWKQVAVK